MATLGSDLRKMQEESYTQNTRLIGHHDLDGSGDGMQIIKYGQYAYIAHVGTSKMALSILDVSDPANPKLIRQLPHPPNTHNHKVQIVGKTLIQNSEFISYIPRTGPEDPVTGLNVYNIDDPTDPKLVAFYPVAMRGVHRIWFREGPYAHIAAPPPGQAVVVTTSSTCRIQPSLKWQAAGGSPAPRKTTPSPGNPLIRIMIISRCTVPSPTGTGLTFPALMPAWPLWTSAT